MGASVVEYIERKNINIIQAKKGQHKSREHYLTVEINPIEHVCAPIHFRNMPLRCGARDVSEVI